MRSILILAAGASLMTAGLAYAAPVGPVSSVSVTFGSDVEKAHKVIGDREKRELEKRLRETIERSVGTSTNGGRLELVIEDAKPNRPTMTQMRNQPGISYIYSFGLGGAKVSGVYIAPDGARTPVAYSWYESDIRNSQFVYDWYDVDRTFDRFARRLKKG